jgi:hypothetical protein
MAAAAIKSALPTHLKPSSAEDGEFQKRHHGKTRSHMVSLLIDAVFSSSRPCAVPADPQHGTVLLPETMGGCHPRDELESLASFDKPHGRKTDDNFLLPSGAPVCQECQHWEALTGLRPLYGPLPLGSAPVLWAPRDGHRIVDQKYQTASMARGIQNSQHQKASLFFRLFLPSSIPCINLDTRT